MLHLNEVVPSSSSKTAASTKAALPPPPARDAVLTLTFDDRRRSRLLARLDDGREVALLLPRGTLLRNGDRLRGDDGLVVEVRAAAENLSVGRTGDTHLLTRVAYHLGNRHVPL